MEIDKRMIKARSALVMGHPFFGALALRLIVVERNDIQTAATDGKFLFYCKAFLDKISEVELIFVVAHEVLHCALSHMTRRGNRRWDLWQAATDYVVNLMLHDAGFTVPKWVKYFDQKYRGLNVEQIYNLLEQEEQKQQKENEDQPGDDQCNGNGNQDPSTPSPDLSGDTGTSPTTPDDSVEQDAGSGTGETTPGGQPSESSDGTSSPESTTDKYAPAHGDPGGCGEVLDATPPHDQAALDAIADEWQVYTRQAVNVARRQGEGVLPGFIEELVDVLNTPQTDWRIELRQFVDPSSTKDYSWVSPNRRMMAQGYYVPGLISDGINHIALLIDTSGSIDYEWLRKFGCEAQAALDDGAIDRITLIFIDEQVHRTAEYTKGELIDFTCQGRGGTEFAPGFDWLNKNEPNVSAAIYFTDLDCHTFGPEPTYPVLWAAYDSNPHVLKARMAKVPFGQCVELMN